MNEFIKKCMPAKGLDILWWIRCKLKDADAKKSYSQEGEDMILRRLFEHKERGLYVDVGAHHPKKFSNTYFFYKNNWHGVNIDALPGSMRAFRKSRPRDINIEVGVGLKKGNLRYYMFAQPALNTFSAEVARECESRGHKVISEVDVSIEPLSDILDKYLGAEQEIDFLSVDVEGLDLSVLRSNDWARHRPRVVLVEMLRHSIKDVLESEVYFLMKDYGYEVYAKSVNTVFFKLIE